MDRFIAARDAYSISVFFNLKSSMDRFIDLYNTMLGNYLKYLKSSMDRFIEMRLADIIEVDKI